MESLQPRLAELLQNKTVAHLSAVQSRRESAIHELRQRLASDERNPRGYLDLARLHMQSRRLSSAIDVLRDGVVACDPDEDLYRTTVFALEEANETEAALLLAGRAATLFPEAPYFKIWEALMLPVLYETEEEIDRYRNRFSDELKKLVAGLKVETPAECRAALYAISRRVNFYLGYQGRNDRDLQQEYGRLVHRIVAANFPEWTRPALMPRIPRHGKIRVGYISAHFRNHSILKLFGGWLEEHNREDFELFAYHNGRRVDDVTRKVKATVDHFRHMPEEFESVCRAVLADDLHALIYLDVRHRRMAMMASLRLAPIQCAAWAHPITSGSPMVDYYLSSETMEPPNGETHYLEQLVRLPGIGVYYPKPVIPRALLGKNRKDYGLDEEAIIFLCCQTTFKYLPQHDHLFAQIAKEVPRSQFVFLALNDVVGALFGRRLETAFSAEGLNAADHCVILPELTPFDYWNLNLVSDVFLDSLEWSGGVTALEAIACGLPVVTLPGEFMRGRHSYGILTQLGVTETIASDKRGYVGIAVRLGREKAWRDDVVLRMAQRYDSLFSDIRPVRALEDFLRTCVRDAYSDQDG